MDFELSDDHRLIQRTVRDFAEQEVAPVAEELDRTKSFPYEVVRQLGELGLMGIPFPEDYGGGGGDSLAYALAVEELTRVDSSVAITMTAHTSLGTQPIYLFGSEEQKREWLPELCAGRRLGAFGLTEPEAGSDAGNTKTRARLEDGEWVIAGRSASRSANSRRSRPSWPTWRPRSRPPACWSTKPPGSRMRAPPSRSPPPRPSSRPAGSPSAAARRPCRSTAATATSRSTR